MRPVRVLAAIAAIALMPAATAAEAETIRLYATTDYAKTVSAVCTVLSPRDMASGLVYFLKAAEVDKKPTAEATTAFCDGFKAAFPLKPDEARAVLDATADAGGAPSPQRKKKKDKDPPPPPPPDNGGGGGNGKYVHIKIKLLGFEFEIEVGQKNPPATEPGDGGGDGGDGGSGRPDSNPPPYNPGHPPQD